MDLERMQNMKYDDNLINECITVIEQLIEDKDIADNVDHDDLFSEAQMYLMEYLLTEPVIDKNFKKNMTLYIRRKMSNYVTAKKEILDNQVDITHIIYFDKSFDSLNVEQFLLAIRAVLNEREFDILTKYFGIYGTPKTQVDIGKEYNITANRVGQIIHNSERKIRGYFMKNRDILINIGGESFV